MGLLVGPPHPPQPCTARLRVALESLWHSEAIQQLRALTKEGLRCRPPPRRAASCAR